MKPFWSHEIIKRACEIYNVSRDDLMGPRRFREYTLPRFAIYYTLRHFGMSYNEIGRRLGQRDHATVRHGANKAKTYIEYEPGFADSICELIEAACPGASDDVTFVKVAA